MSSTAYALKDIGNVLKLRDEIDPDLRVTKHIRANLATVDIIPVDYNLQLGAVNRKNGGMAIVYDFLTPMRVYEKICKHYNLPGSYGGIRLWLTDETQAFEDFSQSFDNNIIETAVNTLSGIGNQLKHIIKSVGNSNAIHDAIFKDGPKIAGSFTRDIANGLGLDKISTGDPNTVGSKLSDILSGGAETAAEIVLQGKQVSLPKIWKTSEYKPTFTMNLKLVAPYGHPECIKHFITQPLLHLMILSSPRSTDGLSYGLFQPVRIKGYGMANVNLGAIDNIQIRRGGRETAYNVYKQPLILDVSINVIPLSDGFAVMDHYGPKDIATFNEASKPYAENITETPAITTLGNIIQSLRPAPDDVVNQNAAFTEISQNPNFSENASPTRAVPPQESRTTTEQSTAVMSI